MCSSREERCFSGEVVVETKEDRIKKEDLEERRRENDCNSSPAAAHSSHLRQQQTAAEGPEVPEPDPDEQSEHMLVC
ncbi:hypothetical protein ATANTOWER_023038 [Ataeniobius toweri]|uniref:Uncharacterized protein n=1 Tax=Ataeniobius toweri TaxID=208326 RepID=A0ABU7A2B4_9TELE|nr:hypothetical protein [Ataeniobius toweri]